MCVCVFVCLGLCVRMSVLAFACMCVSVCLDKSYSIRKVLGLLALSAKWTREISRATLCKLNPFSLLMPCLNGMII